MKKYALMAALCFSLFGAAPVLAETQAAPAVAVAAPSTPLGLAPADRYFGRLKMSILGMRNAIKDIAIRIDATDASEIGALKNLYHKLAFVEESLVDLKSQFPKDTWIASLGLSLGEALMKLQIDDAAVHANDTLDWVIAEYPNTDQAFFAKSIRNARMTHVTGEDIPLESTIGSENNP